MDFTLMILICRTTNTCMPKMEIPTATFTDLTLQWLGFSSVPSKIALEPTRSSKKSVLRKSFVMLRIKIISCFPHLQILLHLELLHISVFTKSLLIQITVQFQDQKLSSIHKQITWNKISVSPSQDLWIFPRHLHHKKP